jgi:ribosome-binding protein aMBF1 (putative translation factor)
MKCPVCRSRTEQLKPQVGEAKIYACTKCGEFSIDDTAAAVLSRNSGEVRQAALEAAKKLACASERPHIGSYPLRSVTASYDRRSRSYSEPAREQPISWSRAAARL